MSGGMAEAQGSSIRTAIQSMINRTCIVSYGIVKEVPSAGIVTVELSVAENTEDIKIITCVLANIASSALTVEITPEVNDKVLVLFPDKFNPEMFDLLKNEAIIDSDISGYDMFSGIAILINQYRKNQHHNLIQIKNGAVSAKLAYSEDDDDNLLVLTTNPDGSFSLSSNNNTATLSADGTLHVGVSYDSDNSKEKVTLVVDNEGAVTVNSNDKYSFNVDKVGAVTVNSNDKYSFNVDKDGAVTVNSNDKYSFNVDKDGAVTLKSNTVTLSVDKDGNITITGKAEAKIDKSGNVTIDAKSGKLSLKNSSASLYTILNGMLQTLNTSLATAGSPASHTVVPQQFSAQSQQLRQLMQ